MYQYACVVGCIFLIREFLVVELCCGKLSSDRLSLSLSLSSRRDFIFFSDLSFRVTFSLASLFFRRFPSYFFFISFVPCCLLYKSVTKGILIARNRHHHHHHVSFNRCWCVPFLFVLDARSASFSLSVCVHTNLSHKIGKRVIQPSI
jgi:hypothetical protein